MIDLSIGFSRGMRVLIQTIFTIVLAFTFTAFAKRTAPPFVEPLQIGDLEFRVKNSASTIGQVECWQVSSNVLIKTIQVYRVVEFPWDPPDAKWICITNLSHNGDTIFVRDEKGRLHKIDLELVEKTRLPIFVYLGSIIMLGVSGYIFLRRYKKATRTVSN